MKVIPCEAFDHALCALNGRIHLVSIYVWKMPHDNDKGVGLHPSVIERVPILIEVPSIIALKLHHEPVQLGWSEFFPIFLINVAQHNKRNKCRPRQKEHGSLPELN